MDPNACGPRPFQFRQAFCECSHPNNGPWNRWGFNAAFNSCINCTLDHIASIDALCGTGLEWANSAGQIGINAAVVGSVFRDNGESLATSRFAPRAGLWSDGLTIGNMDASSVTDNYFVDNSDVSLITGGGSGSVSAITRNTFMQARSLEGAALTLYNWGIGAGAPFNGLSKYFLTGRPPCFPNCGNFTNFTVSGNTIDCGAQECLFGLEVGGRPWTNGIKLCSDNTRNCCTDQDVNCCPANNPNCVEGYPNIFGGTITGNSVKGAYQGLNIAGAGLPNSFGPQARPVTLFGNSVSGSALFNPAAQLVLPSAPLAGHGRFCDAYQSVTRQVNIGTSGNTGNPTIGNFLDLNGEIVDASNFDVCAMLSPVP